MNIFLEPDLKGYYHQSESPTMRSFTWKRWFSSEFQDQFSTRINEHTGLRKSLVRLSNQYDYSLFGLIHAKGFVLGKNGYLFEEDYIHEYNGDYFIGKAAIDKKLSRLKNVKDSLRARNIPLLLVYEPGKASFYPEFIPDRFNTGKRSQTNYEYFVQRSRELGLSNMDMNSYFLKMKDTSRYPLFPRYGMHWSLYGVTFAVDTLSRLIEVETGRQLPDFNIRHLVTSLTPGGTDNDIGELLNLACSLKSTPGAYPSIIFNQEQVKTVKALVVADSYYVNIIEDYGRQLFKTQDYWYYNKKVYPYHNDDPPQYADKSNLRDKLIKFDVVILMVSEINLHCGFWNFADETFLAFHPEIKDPLLYGIENEIRNDRDWFRFMVNKSRMHQKPLEEMIRRDAEYTFYTKYNNLPGKSYLDSIDYIALTIRNSPEWLSQVEKKARERNIGLDSMVMLDAIYSYNQSKKNQ
ncbi:MAG: hypothetical protein WCK84_02145 [Bacteroidota bacterium]